MKKETPAKDSSNQIEFVLNELTRRMRRVYNRTFQLAGVSAQQAAALVFLERFGPQNQNELGERMDLSKAAIGALLARMEDAGLIDRNREDSDGRVRIVSLSRKAMETLARINALTTELSLRLRDGTTSSERRAAVKLLTTMSGNLKKLEYLDLQIGDAVAAPEVGR